MLGDNSDSESLCKVFDHVMIIWNSIELIDNQYLVSPDENIKNRLEKIKKSSKRISEIVLNQIEKDKPKKVEHVIVEKINNYHV